MGGEAAAGGGGILGMLIPMILMIGVFYFLLIRPQSKQRKQLEAKIKGLSKGDKFLTSGGIFMTVIGIKDNIVVGKMGDTKVEVSKSYIVDVVDKDAPKTEPKLLKKDDKKIESEENTETNEENKTEEEVKH